MNSSLIPVFSGKLPTQGSVQLCNARALHAFLEVGNNFSTWIKGRIAEYAFVEGEDYLLLKFEKQVPHQGGLRTVEKIDYHLTMDMAKELAMIENNPQGRKVRRYFIAIEKQARILAAPLLPIDKKEAKAAWALFRELVSDNKQAGMDDTTAWITAGAVTKETTGANLLEYMGHAHLGGDASLLLANKTDTETVRGLKSPQGKLLDWKQRMALHMAVVDLVKAVPEKFQFTFMAYSWLVRTLNVSCEEQIPQHRFIEALNILRVKTECERGAA